MCFFNRRKFVRYVFRIVEKKVYAGHADEHPRHMEEFENVREGIPVTFLSGSRKAAAFKKRKGEISIS